MVELTSEMDLDFATDFSDPNQRYTGWSNKPIVDRCSKTNSRGW